MVSWLVFLSEGIVTTYDEDADNTEEELYRDRKEEELLAFTAASF